MLEAARTASVRKAGDAAAKDSGGKPVPPAPRTQQREDPLDSDEDDVDNPAAQGGAGAPAALGGGSVDLFG